MIVKISARGKSFSGLATYLTHDPDKAKTAERVGWTHTLNCANDHVPSAVDELVWTARAAELLKQEAGIRAGGRATENTVLHASLNWSPEDEPSREHMIETTEKFMEHMGWDERQAILVAHTDKTYQHVHIMLNAVHPENGLCLSDSFEQRRAQAWALEYERENNRIYCEQRLLNADEREDAPTRPAWMAFKENQKEFENAEKLIRENDPDLSENKNNPKIANFEEWKKLKELQRHEREAFFAEGKSEFSELRKSIYREVREEFREDWADYYAAKKDGLDREALAAIKADLIADQKTILETRRDEACKELRESRDEKYRELLGDQQDIRHGLRNRQEAGLDNSLFFRLVEDRNTGKDTDTGFRDAAETVTERHADNERAEEPAAFNGWSAHDGARMKSGADVGARLTQGIGFGLISLFESVADGFVGSKAAPKPRAQEPEPSGPNPFEAAIDAARKEQQRRAQEEAEREWRQKQRSAGD